MLAIAHQTLGAIPTNVDCDLYVEMPDGFQVQGCVLHLFKALEGIKQGAHLFFNKTDGGLGGVDISLRLLNCEILFSEALP